MPDSTLANLTAATAATGGLFYGTQSGVDKKFTSTAAGAALIEAADVAAQQSLLSVLPLSGGTLTGTLTGTTFVGALTGTASGNLVAGGALGTPSSGTLTSCTGLPLSTGVTGTLPIANGGTGSTTAQAARVALGTETLVPGVAQVAVISIAGNAQTSWAGQYVDLDDGTEVCRFWFTVDGSGSAPSAPSPGRLQVVAVGDGSSATEVESAFMIAMFSQTSAFDAVGSAFGYLTVTNDLAAASPSNSSTLSDVSLNITTAGADSYRQLPAIDGSQLTSINAAIIPSPTVTTLGGVIASEGGTGQFVTGVGTSGNLIYSALPTTAIANGGTGQTTAVAAFDALAPTTTKGDLIVHNGTDNIRVAVGGTNGHVLTVDSAQASGVKWAASGGGGGGGDMVLLASATASSSADITFDNEFDSSVYSEYVLKFQGVQPATDNVALRFQLRNSTPASITDRHRNNAIYGRVDAAQTIGNTADLGSTTGWVFIPNSGNAANELISGSINIQPISGQWTHMNFASFFGNETGQRYTAIGAGACEGTTAPAGTTVYFSSGNIARGAFQLYGIKK